ncbi:penicillin-binding protein 2 [Candidatus Gracilibacteria bacterium]|nr:penicillin-binding protein 2 [Candidatus Gracilibacteria bacterium]
MNRFANLRIILISLMCILVVRLGFLQLVEGNYYENLAEQQHKGVIELQSKRGSVYLTDKSGEPALLATDTALDLVFADPSLITPEDEGEVVDLLTPLLFEMPSDEESKDALIRENDVAFDESGIAVEEVANSIPEITPQIEVKETYETLIAAYRESLLKKIQKKSVTHRTLLKDFNTTRPELRAQIDQLQIRGIYTAHNEIYADPTLIDNPAQVAGQLSSYFDYTRPALIQRLTPTKIRYVPLKHKLSPDISEKIKNLRLKNGKKLPGIGLIPEQWRYYPEGTLAAQVIGFLGSDKKGQYGVERAFEENGNPIQLSGVNGKLLIDRDPQGNQIVVGDKIMTPAQDGMDITLTIDRVIQKFVEDELENQVKASQATSGQVIVINPRTGAVIAMANYPHYDPNAYWKSYEKWEQGIRAGEYKNKIGPEAFLNKSLTEMYEPGSVFKVITMAAGIDSGEITPDSINCENENTVYIDDYPVRNSSLQAYGCITMTKALEVSSNLTTLTVAQKLGRTLFYQYIRNFGFGTASPIEIDNQSTGWIATPDRWASIDLAAAAFGQGVGVTPMQMITAVGAIANDGILMKTRLVEQYTDKNTGRTTIVEPEQIRQVIKKDTADKVKAMMVSTTQKSYANTIKLPGYMIAAKTGTAQIALPNGRGYEKEPGSTTASILGFPAEHPEFALLVKIDRPLTSEWGEGTAGPLFAKITDYMLKYYTMPQDRPL